MRPLCGAIITAGALLGLGLTAIGLGARYQNIQSQASPGGEVIRIPIDHMDRPLTFILVFLTVVAIVGLGLAFLGLAYHHHKRHHEHLRDFRGVTTTPETGHPVP